MDLSQINKVQAEEVLKRKMQINREKYEKVRVGLKKDKMKGLINQ
jgi:hypothetical protein